MSRYCASCGQTVAAPVVIDRLAYHPLCVPAEPLPAVNSVHTAEVRQQATKRILRTATERREQREADYAKHKTERLQLAALQQNVEPTDSRLLKSVKSSLSMINTPPFIVVKK